MQNLVDEEGVAVDVDRQDRFDAALPLDHRLCDLPARTRMHTRAHPHTRTHAHTHTTSKRVQAKLSAAIQLRTAVALSLDRCGWVGLRPEGR